MTALPTRGHAKFGFSSGHQNRNLRLTIWCNGQFVLQRFRPVHVSDGSFAPDRRIRDACGMSAFAPKATIGHQDANLPLSATKRHSGTLA
jgi:hypothetical protein